MFIKKIILGVKAYIKPVSMMEKLPRERKQEQHQTHPKNGNFEDSYLIKGNVDLYQVPHLLFTFLMLFLPAKDLFLYHILIKLGSFIKVKISFYQKYYF